MVSLRTALFFESSILGELSKLIEGIKVNNVFWSFLLTVITALIGTNLMKKALNKTPATPDWAVKYLSHFVAVVFVFVFGSFKLINTGVSGFWFTSLFGIMAAFTANGIFDTKIFSFFKKNK